MPPTTSPLGRRKGMIAFVEFRGRRRRSPERAQAATRREGRSSPGQSSSRARQPERSGAVGSIEEVATPVSLSGVAGPAPPCSRALMGVTHRRARRIDKQDSKGDHHAYGSADACDRDGRLDGSVNTQEVSFGLDGTSWTIDLSPKNRTALGKALKPHIAKATRQPARQSARRTQRRAGRPGQGARRAASRPARTDLAEIRAWARSNGYAVSDGGRRSAEVQQAYDSVH